MSQVFSGDSVNMAGTPSLPTSGETIAVTGNFLNPPFQNAKAMVFGSISLTVGSGTTNIAVRIRRNPNAENFVVAGSSGLTVTAGNTVALELQGADAIPDGRPVQYALTVVPTGATGTGTMIWANISAMLISG